MKQSRQPLLNSGWMVSLITRAIRPGPGFTSLLLRAFPLLQTSAVVKLLGLGPHPSTYVSKTTGLFDPVNLENIPEVIRALR